MQLWPWYRPHRSSIHQEVLQQLPVVSQPWGSATTVTVHDFSLNFRAHPCYVQAVMACRLPLPADVVTNHSSVLMLQDITLKT